MLSGRETKCRCAPRHDVNQPVLLSAVRPRAKIVSTQEQSSNDLIWQLLLSNSQSTSHPRTVRDNDYDGRGFRVDVSIKFQFKM